MGSSGTAPGKCSTYSQEQADHQTRRAKIRTHGCRSKANEISMIHTSLATRSQSGALTQKYSELKK